MKKLKKRPRVSGWNMGQEGRCQDHSNIDASMLLNHCHLESHIGRFSILQSLYRFFFSPAVSLP